MDLSVTTFIVENLQAAGVIGGYISISILAVTLITFALRHRVKSQTSLGPKWLQPVIGALLGIIPGCGGTIVAFSMYKNKKLTFGALFAAFIATLGEGAFVLLGATAESNLPENLTAFFIITCVGLFLGIGLGYVVDAIGYRFHTSRLMTAGQQVASNSQLSNDKQGLAYHVLHGVGFYVILGLSVFLLPSSIVAFWGGEIAVLETPTVWATMLLAIASMVYFFTNHWLNKGQALPCGQGPQAVLSHAIAEITMVVTYVVIGLFIVNFIIDVLVGPEVFNEWLAGSAFVVVLIAALIGVTPGCGGMIAVAAAFITMDNFPLAALVAAAIATSGEGIFPLLAENKKDAIIISVASLAAALVVGLLFLAFGFA